MAEELQLTLLGNLEIRRDGVPVTDLSSRKAQALLCYLAVTGRPHLRPRLVGLLWGDMCEANARNNLSKALTHLRQVVEQHLLITRQAVAFDRESCYWLDVEAFEAQVGGASAGPVVATDASVRADIKQLQGAVELYRGDFLEGFYVRQAPAFEEWVLAQRARLRELALQALHRLSVHHAGRGAVGHAEAIDYTTRLLALEPWREEAHRQLMMLLARSGQRGAALAQYEACRQVLSEGLGVEPGAETTALYERIRDGKLGQQAGRLETRAGHAAVPMATPVFHTAGPPPHRAPAHFVAREHELSRLGEYLTRTLDGAGQVAFVTGEAGTGKTALVEEFARRAQARYADLVVAGGNCNAFTGVGDPYLPFREILAQLTGDFESRWVAGAITSEGSRRLWNLIPHTVQSLVRTSPDLIGAFLAGPTLTDRARSAAPDGAPWLDQLDEHLARRYPGQASLNQVDLFEQYATLLATLARQSPLLLVLDDLQWADVGSTHLLFHIARQLASSRILIIGIYRPSEVALGWDGEGHPLALMVHEFERRFGQIQVELAQAGNRQFVEDYLDSEPNRLGAAFREALYGRTKGHALCTVEMLRDMQERGDLMQDKAGHWVEGQAVDWRSLPARVEGVIRQRIERLPAPLRETLEVASVEGEEFTAEVVAQVRGAAELEIIGQLSGDLRRRHRLVVSDGRQRTLPGGRRASWYHFRHILFQDYLYNGLDEAERAYLHEAVGNALEQLYSGRTEPIAIQLARHFQAAARMDKATDYFLQAGDQARSLYALAEARQHYARALEALAHLPDTVENRLRCVDTLIVQAACSQRSDSPERNLARLARAEQLIRGLPGPDGAPGGDRLRLARAHFRMGRVHFARGMYPECVGHYRQALSMAQESGETDLEAIVSSSIGMAETLAGHYGRAEALLAQAIPRFEQTGNWSEWFQAQGYHGIVLAIMGDHARGLAEIQRAHAQAQEVNALWAIIQSNFFLAAAGVQGGDLPRAMEAACEAVELADHSGNRLYAYVGRFFQTWVADRAGQYEAAAAYAAEALTIARELGEPLIRFDWLAAVRADIALGAGHAAEAVSLAEQAVGIAREMGSITSEGMARRAWGHSLATLAPPQWVEAEAQLAESLRLLEWGQSWLPAARTHMAWGSVCRARGDHVAARAHWEQAAAQWESSGLTHELERTRALIDSCPHPQGSSASTSW